MTNGGSSEVSVSLDSETLKTASANLFPFFLTKINKTFKWDFLVAIWNNNHGRTARLWLSNKIRVLMNLDS